MGSGCVVGVHECERAGGGSWDALATAGGEHGKCCCVLIHTGAMPGVGCSVALLEPPYHAMG